MLVTYQFCISNFLLSSEPQTHMPHCLSAVSTLACPNSKLLISATPPLQPASSRVNSKFIFPVARAKVNKPLGFSLDFFFSLPPVCQQIPLALLSMSPFSVSPPLLPPSTSPHPPLHGFPSHSK